MDAKTTFCQTLTVWQPTYGSICVDCDGAPQRVTSLRDYARFDEHHFPTSPEWAHRYTQRFCLGYERMRDRKIVLVGLARNVARILPVTMLRIEQLGRTFGDYRILIYENDSTDDTLKLLRHWESSNTRVEIVSETFKAPVSRPIRCSNRAERMAFYRSRCQARVAECYSDSDYVGIIDTDLEGGWSPDGVASTFGFDDWDFVGSNGIIYKRNGWQANFPAQFDAWAYREHDDFRSLTTKYVNHLQFVRGQPLVPLPSCFGGLGFYRTAAYLAGDYKGDDIEHVSFHRSLHAQGYQRTFLNPSQIVVYGRKHRKMDRWVKLAQRSAYGLWLCRHIPWRYEDIEGLPEFAPHFLSGAEESTKELAQAS